MKFCILLIHAFAIAMAAIVRELVLRNGSLPEEYRIPESAYHTPRNQLAGYKNALDKVPADSSLIIATFSYDGVINFEDLHCMGLSASNPTQHLPFYFNVHLSDLKPLDETPFITMEEMINSGKKHLLNTLHKSFDDYEGFIVTLRKDNVKPGNKKPTIHAVIESVALYADIYHGKF